MAIGGAVRLAALIVLNGAVFLTSGHRSLHRRVILVLSAACP